MMSKRFLLASVISLLFACSLAYADSNLNLQSLLQDNQKSETSASSSEQPVPSKKGIVEERPMERMACCYQKDAQGNCIKWGICP